MGVNAFVPNQNSPLSRIADALKIAHEVYGIKQAGLVNDKLARDAEIAKAQQDPESDASRGAQLGALARITGLQKSGDLTPEGAGALSDLVKGKAATPDVPQQGPAQEGQSALADIPGKPAVHGLSMSGLSGVDEALKPLESGAMERDRARSAIAAAGVGNASKLGRTAPTVSKDYETTMKPFRGLNEDVSRLESALNTKDKDGNPLITTQQLGDANATIARIFSPNHMSDSTVSRTEYESLPAKFSAAIQKFSADPHDIGSRDLINHMLDQAHHIANVSNQNALRELDSLDSGYGAEGVPDLIKNIASAKSKDMRARFGKTYQTIGSAPGMQGAGGIGTDANAAGGTSDVQAAARAEIQRRAKAKLGK